MLLFSPQWSLADVVLSIIIMWIYCGYIMAASNSHLQLIAAHLPSGEELPFSEGANPGVLLPCPALPGWMPACGRAGSPATPFSQGHGWSCTSSQGIAGSWGSTDAGKNLDLWFHLGLQPLWPGWEGTDEQLPTEPQKGFALLYFCHRNILPSMQCTWETHSSRGHLVILKVDDTPATAFSVHCKTPLALTPSLCRFLLSLPAGQPM